MRFSLRWLFGLVLFAAVGSASLVYASRPLSDALAAALGLFLVCVVIGAAYARTGRRAFCGGCAIAGWAYLVCLWLPRNHIDQSSPLPTDAAGRAIGGIYDLVSRELRAEPINGTAEGAYYIKGLPYIRRPLWEPFVKAGHSLIAFFVALTGGALAHWFYQNCNCKECLTHNWAFLAARILVFHPPR
jgi:hypothetical protein